MPKFEMPKFEVPKFEIPTAFREFAEKGIAQAKENYDKVKSAAEQATDVLRGHVFDCLQGLRKLRPQVDRDHAHEQRRRVRSDVAS